MAVSTTAANAALAPITDSVTWISLHTGAPGATGANEVTGGTYARKQTTWGSISGGARTGSQVTIDVPASRNVTHWGIWTASSAGTFYEGFELDLPENFTSAGQYLLTPTVAVQ